MSSKETLTIVYDKNNEYSLSEINQIIKLVNNSQTLKLKKNIIEIVNDDEKQIHESEATIVYTDGACSSNGKSNAKAGIGIYIEETKQEISKSVNEVSMELLNEPVEKPSNNIAELLAILQALNIFQNQIQNKEKIIIKTDSMYSINSVTKWYKNWQKNGWKTAQGKDVLNKNIIKKILEYTKLKNVELKYVKAHAEQPEAKNLFLKKEWFGNMKADQLAKKQTN